MKFGFFVYAVVSFTFTRSKLRSVDGIVEDCSCAGLMDSMKGVPSVSLDASIPSCRLEANATFFIQAWQGCYKDFYFPTEVAWCGITADNAHGRVTHSEPSLYIGFHVALHVLRACW